MEQINFNQENLIEDKEIRNKFLTRLCYLSFIGSGFAVLAGVFYTLFLDQILTILIQNPSEMNDAMAETLSILPKSYFATEAILALFSLIGVIFMWNLKKIGFHFYTIANVLILGLPILFGVGSFSFENFFLISGPFIAMYAFNLKQMN